MNPKTIIDCMKIYQAKLKADLKIGKVWRYSNHGCSGTFEAAEKNENFKANCATIANWCFRKLKVFKSGNYFWGKQGGTLVCSDATLAILKKNCKIIHVNGKKTVDQLLTDGTLQAGDILTYVNLQHTNIYAGGDEWYDAGHAYCKGSGEGAKFQSWFGKTVYGDQKVAYIIRYNGNEQKQTVYRVQVGAYANKKLAEEKAAYVTDLTQYDRIENYRKKDHKVREGYSCFVDHGSDGMYRVFCGSYTVRANAESRSQELGSDRYRIINFILEVNV